jgi:hypothetical protein
MNPSDGQTIELLQTQQSFVEGAKPLDTQLTGRERDQIDSPRKTIVLRRGRSPREFPCFFELLERAMKGMRHGPILGAENVRAVQYQLHNFSVGFNICEIGSGQRRARKRFHAASLFLTCGPARNVPYRLDDGRSNGADIQTAEASAPLVILVF